MKKIKIFNILFFITILTILIILYFLPLKNIYVINNNIVTDQQIIDSSGLKKHQKFFHISKSKIKKKIIKNDIIKKATIKKTFKREIYITIEEYKPLFNYNNKTMFNNNKLIDIELNKPILVDKLNKEYLKKLTEKINLLEDEILINISEIHYRPDSIDKERFLFIMNDNNYVYITFYTFDKMNSYNKIKEAFIDKKGTLYLDVGNYFEEIK